MSAGSWSRVGAALDRWVAPPAPAERLAVLRILVCGFVTVYLAVRAPVMVNLADLAPERFEPLGVLSWLERPVGGLVLWLFAATVGAGVVATAGVAYRASGPLFALGALTLLTYRSSWGQILWFEHLMVLHLLIVGFSPAADRFRWGDRRHRARARVRVRVRSDPAPRYGWPLRLAAIVTVTTYAIAGVAKLRIGGADWVLDGSLANHVAFSAARRSVLGAWPSPLAAPLLALPAAVWVTLAGVALVAELAAPAALVSRRLRDVWVALTWVMHLAIASTMFVVFPYPLSGIAFAPLYRLERLVPRRLDSVGARRKRTDGKR